MLEHKSVVSNMMQYLQNLWTYFLSTFNSTSTKNNSVQASFETDRETICDLENVGRRCRQHSAGTLRHFHRSYLKANKVSKIESRKKVEDRVIFDSVLVLFTQNYQN